MSDERSEDEIRRRQEKAKADVADALQKAITEFEDAPTFLTKYVVLVEMMDSEGERGVYQIASQGLRSWEAMGLLQHANACELAQVMESVRGE